MPLISASDDRPYGWRIWPLETEVTYRSRYWAAHRWDAAPLHGTEPSARALSHSRMWGGMDPLSCTDLVVSLKCELLLPPVPVEPTALPQSVPHFKLSMRGVFIHCDGFVTAAQCCLLRRTQWVPVIVVPVPPLPPQMQSTNPLKKRRSFDFYQKLLSA